MSRHLLRCIAAALCLLLLCGCTDATGLFSQKELLQLPISVQPLDNRQVTEFLGETAQLYYPITRQEQSSSPFTLYDIDADGTEELLVTYLRKGISSNVFLAVFSLLANGEWRLLQKDLEGLGGQVYQPTVVRFSDQDARMVLEYPDGEGQTCTLAFYCLEKWGLFLREQLQTQCWVAGDFLGNGYQQLAEVHESADYGILQLRLYDGAVKSERKLHEVSVSTLDPRLRSCHRMVLNTLDDGDRILMFDFTDSRGKEMSDAVRYTGDRFARCYTSANTNIPNFSSRELSGLCVQDIDSDGNSEIPRQGVVSTAGNGAVYTVFWYGIDRDGETLHSFGVVDRQCFFYLCFPSHWYGRIYLQQEDTDTWSVRQLSDSALLLNFTLTTLGAEMPGEGEWYAALTLGEQVMYLQAVEELPEEDYQQILQQSRLLFS